MNKQEFRVTTHLVSKKVPRISLTTSVRVMATSHPEASAKAGKACIGILSNFDDWETKLIAVQDEQQIEGGTFNEAALA